MKHPSRASRAFRQSGKALLFAPYHVFERQRKTVSLQEPLMLPQILARSPPASKLGHGSLKHEPNRRFKIAHVKVREATSKHHEVNLVGSPRWPMLNQQRLWSSFRV